MMAPESQCNAARASFMRQCSGSQFRIDSTKRRLVTSVWIDEGLLLVHRFYQIPAGRLHLDRCGSFAGASILPNFVWIDARATKKRKGKNRFFPLRRLQRTYFLPPFFAPPVFSAGLSAGLAAVFGLLSAFFFIWLPPVRAETFPLVATLRSLFSCGKQIFSVFNIGKVDGSMSPAKSWI